MNTNEIWQLVEQQFNVFKRKGAGKRPKDWFNKHFFKYFYYQIFVREDGDSNFDL